MRINVIRHVPFEGAANIGEWALLRGFSVDVTKLYQGQPPPGPEDCDFLVVMGGPMNIYEHDKYPWLVDEKRAIGRFAAAGRPVLGVCLGAQLIADVLGGPVYGNPRKEIGFFEVRTTREAALIPVFKHFPPSFVAFHWHGDAFEIPPGAVHAAESEACRNQAFVYGGKVVGLQFHIETTRESMDALIENCADEIAAGGPYVQDADTMRRMAGELSGMRPILFGMLDAMAAEE